MMALTKILVDLPPVVSILLKITAILGLGWTFHLLLAGRNPRWRVLLWRGIVAGVILLPALVPMRYLRVPVARPVEPARQTEITQPPVRALPPGPETFESSSEIINTSLLPALPDSQAQSHSISEPSFSISIWARENIYLMVFSVWAFVALLIAARFLTVLVKIRKKVKSALPAPNHLQHLLDEVAADLNRPQKISLRYSPDLASPFLAGLRSPVIILPKRMVAPERRDELPAIFAHEVAHLRTKDLLWMFATQWVSTALWFHPLVWKLRDAHRAACEEVCDAVAADYVGSTESYSGTLARTALEIVGKIPAVGGIPMARSSEIAGRLRVLKQRIYPAGLARRWVILSGLISFIALTIVGGLSLVYAEDTNANKSGTRIIHFPKDRSMGLVHVGELRTLDPLWWQGWEAVGQAKGDVRVPLNKAVRLDISTEASEDILPLAALGSDDIQAITFNWNRCNVNDNDLKHLSGLTGLKHLALSSTQIKGPGLVHLSGLKSLEALLLGRTEISDDSLKHVARLKSLKRLDLSSTKVTDAGLVHLRNLRSLERIDLGSTGISGKGFSSLADTTSINTLWLNHSDITDEGLKHIAKMKSLERLSLVNTAISDRGIEHISRLKALKKLNLSTFGISKMKFSGAALSYIAKLTSLESLELPGGITDADLAKLKGLTGVKRLDIGKAKITGAGLDFLKELKSLEFLQLPMGVTDKELEVLKELTSLEELQIQNSSVTNKGLSSLSHLKSLKRLMLFEGRGGDDKWEVTSKCLSYLRDLPIKSLHIREIELDDSRLTYLAELTQLEELKLRKMSLYDEDLANLSNLVNLKQLSFDSETVSHGGIAHLADLTCLEDLSLRVPMNDTGLSHLTNLDKLQRLHIKGNITEKGLNHLAKLKALRTLRITSGNDFSNASIEQLQKELPMLQRLNVAKDRKIRSPSKTGTLAPQFSINTIDDKKIALEDYRGMPEARVLHFPMDRSLGRVTFADADIEETRYDFHFWYGQPEYKEAEGNVVVPPGKEAALFLYKDSFRDLSPLLELKPDDLFMLCPMSTFHEHPFSQRNMEHIAHLTGLRVLTIRSIGNSSENMKPMTKLQSLEKLILPHGTTNRGLSYVSQIKSLKRLIFARNKVTNAGIKRYIPKLTNLEYLALYGGIMNDYCLQCLADLPSLRELSLNSGNFTDAGLSHVKKCSSLRILDLNHLPITDEGLRHLSVLSGLEDLSLFNTEVTDRGLVYLKSMPSLKKLDIKKMGQKDQITDAGMVHLAQIDSLEYLELGGITDRGMAHIAKLKNLKHLWGGGSTDAALEHISKLQSLEYLHTGSSGYTDAGMSHLAKLTNLKDLRLYAESITSEGLAKLRTLKSLERLQLGKCNKVTISGLSALNALNNLTELNLKRGIIQDNSGLDISGLTKLEDLRLNVEAPLCDNDLACLKKLKNLRLLRIGRKEGHSFTDAGIAHLIDLPNIRELSCHSPYLTDTSLSYLANIKTLNFLTIIGNFTDEGLGYLEELKTLRSLTIYSASNFSPAAIRQLKERLPNLWSFTAEQNRVLTRKPKNNPEPTMNDKVAPSFALKTLDGKHIKLDDYRGKVVILYFWATWCRPCVAGTPKLKKTYEDLKASFSDDFEMISLSMDNNEESVREHIRKYGLTWPQVRIGLYSKISSEYGVNDRAPKYFLIGPDGKLLLTPESPQVDTKAFIEKVLKNRKT